MDGKPHGSVKGHDKEVYDNFYLSVSTAVCALRLVTCLMCAIL